VVFFEQAADFLGAGRIEKNVKCIGVLAQQVRRASPHHHGISLGRNPVQDFLHHLHHAVGVEGLGASGSAAIVTPAPERLGQAIEATVHFLVAAPHRRSFHVGDASNLLGEKLVPKLPAQVCGQLHRNRRAAATVLAFDGNEPEHNRA
jgi:hypothetical protein